MRRVYLPHDLSSTVYHADGKKARQDGGKQNTHPGVRNPGPSGRIVQNDGKIREIPPKTPKK